MQAVLSLTCCGKLLRSRDLDPHGRTCSGTAATGHVPTWHRAAGTAGEHRLSGPLPAQLLFLVVFPSRRAAITRKHCRKREERVKGLAQEGHKALGSLLAASGGSLNGSREPVDALCVRRRGQEAKALHLADSCDLGLRVHQVEPQTVFELPSVTINIGDVRACNNPSARALPPHLASLSPPNLRGSSSSPSAASGQDFGWENLPRR